MSISDINECASSPCQNGGTCTDDVNRHVCACLPGFIGDRCHIGKNSCWKSVMRPNACFRLACRSPLCRYGAWSSLAVSELQLSAATPLWLYHRAASLPSWIEFNCLRSAVGKAGRLSIYWQDAACRLVIPLRQVALAQLYKYHHQSGNAASGKLVWKQHYSHKISFWYHSMKHTFRFNLIPKSSAYTSYFLRYDHLRLRP